MTEDQDLKHSGGLPALVPGVDPQSTHRSRNFAHTVILIAGIGFVVFASSMLLFGWIGSVVAVVSLTAMLMLAPSVPPEFALRLYRAQPIDPALAGRLDDVMAELARRAGLPFRPSLYVIPSMTLNAFSTGSPERSAIAVTEGLLRRLSMRETVAVLAHEVAHIRNNDLKIMALADVMTRFTFILSYVAVALAVMNVLAMLVGDPTMPWIAIVLLYLAPTISSLLQLALSRAREYDADRTAVELTSDPVGLGSALRRIERYTGNVWEDLLLPVPARRVPQPSLLRTHPSTSDRVARLIELQGRSQGPTLVVHEGPRVSLVGLGPMEMRPRYRFPGLWY
jgi:heat shock protein HtpX